MLKTKSNDNIVTNLRIPEADLRSARVVASDLGISFNEYVKTLLERDAKLRNLGVEAKTISKKSEIKKNVMEQILDLAQPFKEGDFSDEDSVIYG